MGSHSRVSSSNSKKTAANPGRRSDVDWKVLDIRRIPSPLLFAALKSLCVVRFESIANIKEVVSAQNGVRSGVPKLPQRCMDKLRKYIKNEK